MMTDEELDGVHGYLSTKLSTKIFVSESEEADSAVVYLEETELGRITRIEDEGEVEYQFEVRVSAEKYPDSLRLESHLCQKINSKIRLQSEEDEHMHICIDGEFIGLVYKAVGDFQDEHLLQIPILPEDFPE